MRAAGHNIVAPPRIWRGSFPQFYSHHPIVDAYKQFIIDRKTILFYLSNMGTFSGEKKRKRWSFFRKQI